MIDLQDDRERGPYLEQGRYLLDQIDVADPRRIAHADPEWCAAVQRMRTTIADHGRVRALDLVAVRTGWPRVRDRELPPEPRPAPAQRSFIEPADAP